MLSLYTLITFTATFVISTVSAQTPRETPSIGLTPACKECVYTAAHTTSPSCEGVDFPLSSYTSNLTVNQRTCGCALASNRNWAQPCIQPGLCEAVYMTAFIERLVDQKDRFCAGITLPPPSTSSSPSSSSTAAPSSTSSTGTTPSTSTIPKNDAGARLGSYSMVVAGTIAAVVLF
ncbi:hypothetical protein BGX23_001457 [Mortierella sp. AD031]|nr:hypothetical protein BGX23_001457 [Mortierella sp. AD031]